jgi:uncharacterized protein YfdQ (DUF2303 family)
MEIEKNLNFSVNETDWRRAKTSLRMNYEAQVEIIKHQIGGLEEVRLKLGLNARKMSQLLLVDPSAWTRWTRDGGDPPPHVWRALQWYLALIEKVPGLTPGYFLSRTEVRVETKDHAELSLRIQELEAKIANNSKNIKLYGLLAIPGWLVAGILAVIWLWSSRG